jgi:hypothetical protein
MSVTSLNRADDVLANLRDLGGLDTDQHGVSNAALLAWSRRILE